MPKVFQLGHVALGVADMARAKNYYEEVLGLQHVESGPDGAQYLSVAWQHHDFVLKPADGKTLLNLGYRLGAGVDLAEFGRELSAIGLKPQTMTDSQPGIARLVEVEVTPGNFFQFYAEMDAPSPGYSRRGVSPLRLGHVAVVSPDAARLIGFYRDFLGFHETDRILDLATFLTCNHEHHVVNVVNAPPTMVHHVAFQLSESAQHAVAADRLRAAGIQTRWGPSRHTAGHNLAAYHKDPNDLLIELYTDMDVYLPALDMFEPRPWHETVPLRPQVWGPEFSNWGVEFAYDLARG